MTPAKVDHESRRASLTAALLESVAEQGIEGASVRSVAARAGVSIGTVQHYFSTKEAMLLHAYRTVGDDLGARAEERADASASPRDALREVLLELLPLDARRLAAFRINIAFVAHSLQSPALAKVLQEDLAELEAAVIAICELIGVAQPALEARLALSVTAGLSEPLLFGDGSITQDAVIAALDAHLDRAFG